MNCFLGAPHASKKDKILTTVQGVPSVIEDGNMCASSRLEDVINEI